MAKKNLENGLTEEQKEEMQQLKDRIKQLRNEGKFNGLYSDIYQGIKTIKRKDLDDLSKKQELRDYLIQMSSEVDRWC